MSKFVLQTFHVTDTFLQGVRQKASIYPEDINLAKVCGALFWKICAKIAAIQPMALKLERIAPALGH